MLIDFRERGREGKREEEKHRCERNAERRSLASHVHPERELNL